MKSVGIIVFILCFVACSLNAGEVTVVGAKAFNRGNNIYRFDVTLRHADKGWKHYADSWEILTEKGTLLGKRVLLHPHENERPFTRSLNNVRIPEGIKIVIVRGHDKIHKFGGKNFKLVLPGR